MNAGSLTAPSMAAATSTGPSGTGEATWRRVARFGLAGTVSAAICLWLWSRVSHELAGPEPIVGYPTFVDFAYMPQFWLYRLVVYVFPLLLFVGYSALAWRGPLRRRTPTPKRAIRLLDATANRPIPAAIGSAPAGSDEATGAGPGGEATSSFRLGPLLRLALPAGVVVEAAVANTNHVPAVALASGFAYVVAVFMLAGLCTRLGPRTVRGSFARSVAWTNGVGGAAIALVGIWYVSRHTVVVAAEVRRVWPWFPLWLAAVGIGAVVWWSWYRRERPVRDLEKRLLTYVVGPAALVLATSVLPGQVPGFQGYEDGLRIVGGSLISRGYLPWRDFMFIHGVYPDALQANLGFLVFEHSIWSMYATTALLVYPIFWVFTYLYAAWVSHGNPWLLSLVAVGAVSGFLGQFDARFILMPIALIVLGETIRRRSVRWCVALALLLFVQAILVPETSFFAVPAVIVVAAADLVHRDGAGIWPALRRTRWCVGAAAAALLCLVVALAAIGALRGFIDYYVVFGPGHNVSGALHVDLTERIGWYWSSGVLAVLVTVWLTVSRFRRRGDWEAGDWVALSLTMFLAFYNEKALGRWDSDHTPQVFTIAFPLILWWLWKLLRGVDQQMLRWFAQRLRHRRHTLGRPSQIAFAAPLVLVVCVISWHTPLIATARGIDTRHHVVTSPAPDFPGIGYMATGAIDLGLVRDLGAALRAYAGEDQPVFDMTNSPGYIYYLLGRDPATTFVHVSMAEPPYSQQLLIQDLQRSRPPVVIFDADRVGMSAWDGIYNDVRHYEVSDYVLDNWVPVMRTHGLLLMLRRDLVKPGLAMPTLAEPPVTTELWFSGVACNWGTTPDFIQSKPSGTEVTLPVRDLGQRSVVAITGWAADRSTGLPAPTVVLASEGKVVSTLTPALDRPDVAQKLGTNASPSGFRYAGAVGPASRLSVYVLGEDGKLHLLDGSEPDGAPFIVFPDGRQIATSTSTTHYTGHVDAYQSTQRAVSQIDVPAGLRLSDYDLATLSAGGKALLGRIEITDQIGPSGHDISATSVPRLGVDMGIRVGSCIQWHGFDPAKPLYVVQDNGPKVATVTLSAVRN